MQKRCRCSECRRSFEPSPRAGKRARVCGPECRRLRRRRQKKRRREADLEGYRADERERQRQCRARRREETRSDSKSVAEVPKAPVGRDGCHGPTSAGNRPISEDKVSDPVAELIRVSRTSFERELTRLQRRLRGLVGSHQARAGP